MDFLESVKENKLTWTLGTIAWLASCVLVEKIQLRVLASSQAEEADRTNKLNKLCQTPSTSLITTSILPEESSTNSAMAGSTLPEQTSTLPEETLTLSNKSSTRPEETSVMSEKTSSQSTPPVPTLPESLTRLPWYTPTITSMLTPACADLLTNYAHVPPSEHESYIYHAVRILPKASSSTFKHHSLNYSNIMSNATASATKHSKPSLSALSANSGSSSSAYPNTPPTPPSSRASPPLLRRP
jgi:hypothetical protein